MPFRLFICGKPYGSRRAKSDHCVFVYFVFRKIVGAWLREVAGGRKDTRTANHASQPIGRMGLRRIILRYTILYKTPIFLTERISRFQVLDRGYNNTIDALHIIFVLRCPSHVSSTWHTDPTCLEPSIVQGVIHHCGEQKPNNLKQ